MIVKPNLNYSENLTLVVNMPFTWISVFRSWWAMLENTSTDKELGPYWTTAVWNKTHLCVMNIWNHSTENQELPVVNYTFFTLTCSLKPALITCSLSMNTLAIVFTASRCLLDPHCNKEQNIIYRTSFKQHCSKICDTKWNPCCIPMFFIMKMLHVQELFFVLYGLG